MVYLSIDKQYYSGTINNTHRDGSVTVLYDDGVKERLNSDNEECNYESLHASSRQIIVNRSNFEDFAVKDKVPKTLQHVYYHFRNKSFLRFQVQAFEIVIFYKSYKLQEKVF